MMKSDNTFTSFLQGSLHYLRFRTFFFVGLLIAMSLGAQETGKGKQDSPMAKEEGDVPDKHIEFAAPFQSDAQKAVREANERLQNDLRRLYVIVKNYGSEVPSSQQDFDAIKDKYKKALIRFYKRQNTWAWDLHKKNREKIRELYGKFMLKYKENTLLLLAELAEKLASEKIEQSTTRGQKTFLVEPGRVYLKHLENSIRLKLAYQQNVIAREMEVKELPQKAIEHYRLAKVFVIHTLRRMEKDPNRQKELDKKYSKDILDSRGLIASKE